MPNKTALIAGATGLVGSHLLELLRHDAYYDQVLVLTRREISIGDAKISQIISDLKTLESHKDVLVADHIFCCLGTTMKKAGSKEAFRQVDLEYPLKLAEFCLANEAEQYLLVSSLGANKNSGFFYNRIKGEVEEAIRRLEYRSYNVFQPSLILGERNENRIGEAIGKALVRGTSFLLVGGLRKYRGVHAKTIANSMITVAKNQRPGFHIHSSDEIQKYWTN